MSISWLSMPLVLLIAKVRSILYLNVNEFFLSATRDFIHVCVCACVGVGLWRCMYVSGLEYKMQSAAQFQQVEDIFIMTSISFSLFAAADAALPLCAATAAAAVFLFVCVYETVGFAHFRILFCLSQKKHPVVF